MSRTVDNVVDVEVRVAKGWKPNRYLSNMSIAVFADMSEFVAPRVFPVCPVDLSTGYYYVFDRGDLVRDYMARKEQCKNNVTNSAGNGTIRKHQEIRTC